MTTLTELRTMYHLDTDLVKVARLIPAHRAGILLCDEKHVHVYTTAGCFSVEWVDWEYPQGGLRSACGGTNHEATATAIEKRFSGAH